MEEKKKTGILIWKVLAVIILIIAVLLAAAYYLLFIYNNFFLEIRMNGSANTTVEYGEVYEEQGAKVYFCGTKFLQDGILLEEVIPETTGSVDGNALGRYTVSYAAEYKYWKSNTQRTVSVLDTECPVIELTPGSEETILPGTIYEEPGFKATDNYDGDITDKVIRKEDMGVITYAVIDSSGNPAYTQREIPYHDPMPPELTLEGDEAITITVGTFFEDPGFKAQDNVDGDITEQVVIEGEVDWLNAGTYTLNYSVSDEYQNTVSAQRTVEVVSIPRVDVKWPTEKTIYLTFDDGPGPYTKPLLDILDRYGAKATFFVVDSGYYGSMREIVKRGHSIGIHSVTHNYEEIYSSPEAYFKDLLDMQELIYYHTGVKTTLMRFPGGGSNMVSKNTYEGLMTLLTEKVQDAGFQYFDWNVDSDDAGQARKSETVRDNVIEGVQQQRVSVVLQHDIHSYSVDAVEEILKWGTEHGYRFRALKNNSPGMHHWLNN